MSYGVGGGGVGSTLIGTLSQIFAFISVTPPLSLNICMPIFPINYRIKELSIVADLGFLLQIKTLLIGPEIWKWLELHG